MPLPSTERNQVNLRMSDDLRIAIDAKRMELAGSKGSIPTRSDVLRIALARYLDLDVAKTEVDRRTLSKEGREVLKKERK